MADPDLSEFNDALTLSELRKANATLARQLGASKIKTAELTAAVKEAVTIAISTLEIPPVTPPVHDKRRRDGEVAVAVLSDWQLAKKTPTYSSEVCEQRIELYADKVIKLTEIQRADHPVRELRVYLLGDIVEGELIFPGQAHLTDASLYQQVCVDGPRILANFVRRMLSYFEKVHVVGVIGNHGAIGGRARRDYHPESNADAMLMEITRQLLASESRLTWAPNSTSGERHWYATDTIGDHTFFMAHGDQVRGGFAGLPWYGFYKKILGWRTSGIIPEFDYALTAHYHTPVRMYLNGVTLWGNGSTESYNTYALENLAASGEPCQWLLFCSPRRGVSAEYLVHLDKR